jgi:hypothetical protein
VNDPNRKQDPQTIQSQTRSISSQMTSETYDLLCNDPYIKYYFGVWAQESIARTDK